LGINNAFLMVFILEKPPEAVPSPQIPYKMFYQYVNCFANIFVSNSYCTAINQKWKHTYGTQLGIACCTLRT
jgi:hypothetical protein